MGGRDLDIAGDDHAPVVFRPDRVEGEVVFIRQPTVERGEVFVHGHLGRKD